MADTLLKGGEFLIAETAAEDVFTPEDFSDEQKQFGETTERFVTNELVPKLEEHSKMREALEMVEALEKGGQS